MTEQEQNDIEILKIEEEAEHTMTEEQLNMFFEYGFLLEKRAILREMR